MTMAFSSAAQLMAAEGADLGVTEWVQRCLPVPGDCSQCRALWAGLLPGCEHGFG